MDLSFIPCLRKLVFKHIIVSKFNKPAVWVASLFSQITSPHRLETICVKLKIYSTEIDWSSWKSVDTMLNSPHLSDLAKVGIEFGVFEGVLETISGRWIVRRRAVYNRRRTVEGDMMQDFEPMFPALRQRGILDIRVS